MGPPKFHPKSLKRSGGFNCLSVVPGGGLSLLAGFTASVISLRMNSKAPPWNWLPPLRVTTLTDAPLLRPYSAEKLEVLMETSWIKSMPTLLSWVEFEPESMLKPPSTEKLLPSARRPLTLEAVGDWAVVSECWSKVGRAAAGMSQTNCT